MRQFSKVSPRLWQSSRFGSLTEDEKLTFLYLLTSEHQNLAGCYRLPDGYATADLRWPVDRYLKARDGLVKAGMIQLDPVHSVVLIERWFEHNPPMNDSHETGIERQLDRIESDVIREAALEALSAAVDASHAKKAAKRRKRETLAGDSAQGFGGNLPQRLQNTPYLAKANR